jgi:hypothetical protein
MRTTTGKFRAEQLWDAADLVGSEYRILGLTSRLWELVFDHAAMWYSLVSPSRIGLRCIW